VPPSCAPCPGRRRRGIQCVVVSRYAEADRERWVREDPAHKRADRDDFARDRARVLHSASLRRLSAKTQVVQPDSDDFVRNRLTHSLEVAQIGREFGATLGCDADVVDTACLAHDLGHPPFGHNGETALNEIAADIGGFEGNAQTLRLLTRLEAKRVHPDGRPAGLNLTRASLDAVTKYPWGNDESRWGTAKFGVYADDLEVFRWYRGSQPDGRRCLEAQAMDWSDDVAYSVHDVEDGVASERLDLRALHTPSATAPLIDMAQELYAPDLSETELTEALARLIATGWIPQSYNGSRTDLAALKDMTSMLIGRFVQTVGEATRAKYGDGPLTRYAADLVIPDDVRAECAVMKGAAAYFVMFTDERRDLMGGQRAQIHDLVDAYRDQPEARLDPLHLGDYLSAPDDGAALRAIIDQVASLSDPRAKVLHQRWC
jgi:dGTPase